MKFAKHLARAINISDPEWDPFWINYKQLKKLLNPNVCIASNRGSNSSCSAAADTASPATGAVSAALALPAAAAAAASAAEAQADENLSQWSPPAPPRAGEGRVFSGGTEPNDDDPHEEASSSTSIRPRTPPPGPPSPSTSTSNNTNTSVRRPQPWEAEAPAPAPTATASRRKPSLLERAPSASHGGGSSRAVETEAKREQEQAAAAAAAPPPPELSSEQATKSASTSGGGGAASGQPAAGGVSPWRERPRTVEVRAPAGRAESRPAYASNTAAVAATATTAAAAVPAVVPGCCAIKPSSCAAAAAAAATAYDAGVGGGRNAAAVSGAAGGGRDRSGSGSKGQIRDRDQPPWQQLQQPGQCRCPFFAAVLGEVHKCRMFFLDSEAELKVRSKRLQRALDQLRRPDLSRLSGAKDAHLKLMQACVNFYRDALLLEDFAMLNYTAVVKVLKKRDRLAGTSDQRPFMASVMVDQPFARYTGVAKRVAQVEQIFRDIEGMCFLRTGEGMKPVTRKELTVVEAIMQLAQESKELQQKELDGMGASNNVPPQPGPAATHQQQQRPQPPSQFCADVGGGAGGVAVAAYAGEQAAREAARTWAGTSSSLTMAARGGCDGVATANPRGSSSSSSDNTTKNDVMADSGSGSGNPYGPSSASPRSQPEGGGERGGGWAVATGAQELARPPDSGGWVLSKHATRGGWGARRGGRQTAPLTSSNPAPPSRFSAVLSARPRDASGGRGAGGAGGAGGADAGFAPAFSAVTGRGRCSGAFVTAATTGGGAGVGVGGAEVAEAVRTSLPLGARLATSPGLVGHGDRVSKQARLD
eukprot:g13723.t1